MHDSDRWQVTRAARYIVSPLVLFLACAPLLASPPGDAPAAKPITVQMDTPISVSDMLRFLTQESHLQIITGTAQDLNSKMLQVNVRQQPPDQVLREICKQANITCDYDSATNTWYVNREVLDVPTSPGDSQSAPRSTAPSYSGGSPLAPSTQGVTTVSPDTQVDQGPGSAGNGKFETAVVPVVNMDCREMMRELQSPDLNATADPLQILPYQFTLPAVFQQNPNAGLPTSAGSNLPYVGDNGNSDWMGSALANSQFRKHVGVPSTAAPGPAGNGASRAGASAQSAGGNPLSSGGYQRSERSGDGFAQFPGGFGGGGFGGNRGGFGGGGFPGAGGFGGAPGGFGGAPGGFGGAPGGFGGAPGGFGGAPGGFGGAAGGPGGFGQAAVPGAGQGLSAFLPPGTELIPFVQNNSILVLGTPAAIDRARDLINLLDVPRQYIRLRVKKLLVRENQGHSVGVDYSLGSPAAIISTATGANLIAGTLNVFMAQNNVSVKLLALETASNARTVAEPTILTANGVGVFVSDFTQNLAVIPGATAGFGGQGTPPQVIPTGLTGIGLQILPRLMRDGTIMIYSSITDNGQIGSVQVPGGTPIPIQSNVSFPIPGIPVPNGGTMMVGGFVSHDQSHDRTAVPILGDLPLIGGLFRTVNDTSSDTETLYFISAELIDVNGQPIPGGPDAVKNALGGAATVTGTTGAAGELPPPGGLTNGTVETPGGTAPPLPPPTPIEGGGV